jgi:dTDP-4-dehydrorhamnose reductase
MGDALDHDRPPSSPEVVALELWGGHECTVNRIGDRFFDQTVRSGHQDRLSDLQRFADLGVKALRYPVLWERVSPDRADQRDWSWTDERLGELQKLGVRVIAGLVHHGSGPRYTHLLDDGFATGLADHARAAALRYPWIKDWTPVNEPLTTARFSALYGHWYPHARDEGAFFSALLNQIDAVRLSMKAIREVIPDARLIQTDDLGHTFATPPLEHQAAFDNERRWLGWDLLTGRLAPGDVMWRRMAEHGLEARVAALVADPCPPDVVGVNYYLSSERFLDHRADRYPLHCRGHNFEQSFADVEAVRAVSPGPMGIERLVLATFERYGLPIAVTECHNGCTREEQMRWLGETWESAVRLRQRGVPILAVTVWSLLGAFDWNRLLTVDGGHYEVGVFDLRAPEGPRPTAMADLCRQLADEGLGAAMERHPVMAGPGWWSRDIRYIYEPVRPANARGRRSWRHVGGAEARPILITGESGVLGRALARACEHRGLPFVLTDRRELAINDASAIERALNHFDPWAVMNAAGFSAIDEAEQTPQACLESNGLAVERLVEACDSRGVRLVGFSSDQVFDGRQSRPYVETDTPHPLNIYGRSKALAEQAMARAADALMIRTGAFFSPDDEFNFAHHVVHALSRRQVFAAAGDLIVSPTYLYDLVEHALNLLIDGERGVWHLANIGETSWADFARALAAALDLDERLVQSVPATAFGWAAARPTYAALGGARGALMPTLASAIAHYADVVRPRLIAVPAPTLHAPRPPIRRLAEPALYEPKSFAATGA